jgi:hypothetical protein
MVLRHADAVTGRVFHESVRHFYFQATHRLCELSNSLMRVLKQNIYQQSESLWLMAHDQRVSPISDPSDRVTPLPAVTYRYPSSPQVKLPKQRSGNLGGYNSLLPDRLLHVRYSCTRGIKLWVRRVEICSLFLNTELICSSETWVLSDPGCTVS